MLSNQEIFETIKMIQNQNLDIRTITMGISLLDCMDSDIDKSCEKVYKKIKKCNNYISHFLYYTFDNSSNIYKKTKDICCCYFNDYKCIDKRNN